MGCNMWDFQSSTTEILCYYFKCYVQNSEVMPSCLNRRHLLFSPSWAVFCYWSFLCLVQMLSFILNSWYVLVLTKTSRFCGGENPMPSLCLQYLAFILSEQDFFYQMCLCVEFIYRPIVV